MVIERGGTGTFTLRHGDHINFSNRQPEAIEIVVAGKDGFEVRFNLLVGHRTSITVGSSELDVTLNHYNDDLVGIQSEPD